MSDIKETFPNGEEPEELAEPATDKQIEAEKPKTKQTSVARSAGIVSIAVMFSRVLGLVREMIFANYFGAGFLYDAYQAAFTIPNVLRDLFAEGALSAAFVKVFTDYQIKKSEEEAWRLASLILNALAVILSLVVIIGIIFTPQLVAIVASGFSPEKAALDRYDDADNVSFYFACRISGGRNGSFEHEGNFRYSGFGFDGFQCCFNIFRTRFCLLVFRRRLGKSYRKRFDSDNILTMGNYRNGNRNFDRRRGAVFNAGSIASESRFSIFAPILNFTDEGVKKIMRLMAPAILGTSAVQINVLVNLAIVSPIDGGRIWLSYAFD